jgi:hypothetical protein
MVSVRGGGSGKVSVELSVRIARVGGRLRRRGGGR